MNYNLEQDRVGNIYAVLCRACDVTVQILFLFNSMSKKLVAYFFSVV